MKRKFNRETRLTLDYDSGFKMSDGHWHETSAISEDAVTNVCNSLNDGEERFRYSSSQVRAALWVMLKDHVDDYLVDIEYHFDNLSDGERDRLLGTPEIDVSEEQQLEAVDVAFDAARDAALSLEKGGGRND